MADGQPDFVHAMKELNAPTPHPWTYGEKPLPPCSRVLAMLFLYPLLLLLFPVRLLLFLFSCLLSWLCCFVGGWSPTFVMVTHRIIGRMLFVAMGVWPGMLRVKGKLDRAAPVLVIGPHQGVYDALMIMTVARAPRPIALAHWAKLPLAAPAFRAFGGIVVNVSAATSKASVAKVVPVPSESSTEAEAAAAPAPSATSSTRQAIVEHKRGFKAGEKPICLFPEGTTSNGRALLQFFSGAFECAATLESGAVQPIVVTYPYRHFHPAAFLESAPVHIARALLTPWQAVRVQILPLVTPTKAEAADSALYAENVRKLMAEAAGLPLSAYDARALRKEWRDGDKPAT